MNTTRNTPSGQRQRVKPRRTCRLEPTADADVFLLVLTVAGKPTSYLLRSIGSADAECGLRLEKLTGGGDVEDVYDVELFASNGYHGCSCKGFCSWGHCKHVEAAVALHQRGQLAPVVCKCKPVCRPVGRKADADYLDSDTFDDSEAEAWHSQYDAA